MEEIELDIEGCIVAGDPIGTFRKFLLLMTQNKNNRVIFSDPLSGNKILYLEIPAGIHHIPGSRWMNCNNWTIIVKANYSMDNPWLFYIRHSDSDRKTDTHITSKDIDDGLFANKGDFSEGKKLLIAHDKRMWTQRTDSADLSYYYRADAIVVKDGIAQNKPISDYSNEESSLDYYYYEETFEPGYLKNLNFCRDPNSTQVFGLATLQGICDFEFRNINVWFSSNGTEEEIERNNNIPRVEDILTGDTVFHIFECANIVFDDVCVNGTYSKPNTYGYAFYLNTVTNIKLNEVKAYAYWGATGFHCVQDIFITGGILNRFDTHCYGRNAKIIRTIFRNSICSTNNYNQVSSFFGEIVFTECTFDNFYPLLFEPSYHLYTGFKLLLNDCIFIPNNAKVFVKAGYIDDAIGSATDIPYKRKSLRGTNWPDVHITNLDIQGTSNGTTFYLFWLNNSVSNLSQFPIGNIKQATITLKNQSQSYNFRLCNKIISTINNITTKSSNIDETILI